MDKELHDRVIRKLVDEGRLMEAGWLGMRMAVIPADAPPVQVDEMRKAFFAGAQHVFASIMGLLEPGAEPTDNDLRRLNQISEELTAFTKQMKRGIN